VEHIKAVENLSAILTTPGVDGYIIGPYDLSGSLGVPGRFEHPSVVQALERVKEVTAQLGALSGYHVIQPDPDAFIQKANEGYRFIAFSLDILFLGKSCRDGLKNIKEHLNH
jgi:2-dehydro-3-deoxyglucarate aldolase